MSIPSESQRDKAASVLTELLESYGDVPQQKVARFNTAMSKVLESADVMLFGRAREPDRYLGAALKKANIPDSAITDVIMITFEPEDKIRYWLDGAFHER